MSDSWTIDGLPAATWLIAGLTFYFLYRLIVVAFRDALGFKVRLAEGAKLPARGTPEAAGLDLPFLEDTTLPPHATVVVPTGIYAEVPKGYFGLICPRSSGFKRGLVTQGIIDSDYRGEICVVVLNATPFQQSYLKGTACAQMVLVPYGPFRPTSVEELNQTGRGERGFGSTGKVSP